MSATQLLARQARRSERAAAHQAGVTLIEIMIVLAIIGLIMGFLVGPAVFSSFAGAKIDSAYNMAKNIEGAHARWAIESGESCPSSIDDLKKAMGKSTNETIKDPWNHPYILKCGEGLPEGCDTSICVSSMGPDGKEGTADDIRSWMDKPKK